MPRGRSGSRRPRPLAAVDPVARVLVETPLAHLDRPFDYAVPASMADSAVPGARVKVRFAGKDLDGFVVARSARHRPHRHPHAAAARGQRRAGAATRRRRARRRCSPSATPAPAPTCSASRSRPATRPPRSSPPRPRSRSSPTTTPRSTPGAPTRRLRRSSTHLAGGGSPRAVWSALPGEDWPRLLAQAAATTLAGGRGSVLCVPDHRDVARLDAALTDVARARPPRGAHRRRRAGPALPRVPGGRRAAPVGSWSAPVPRRSRPSTTSGWWRSGTTATTCTPSPARRTPTPVRCC